MTLSVPPFYDTFDALLGVCDLTMEAYGEPSAELLEASAGLNVEVYRFFPAA